MHTDTLTFPGLLERMFDTAIAALMLTNFLEGSQDRSLYANNLKTKVLLMVHHGARDYFSNTIIITLARQVALYKSCKLVNPIAMQD